VICEPHKCPCRAEVNKKGYHRLSCKKSVGRLFRHEGVNDIVARALRSAEFPCIREPAGCSRDDGKRPDGLPLVPWSRGIALVWDFTFGGTMAQSYINNTSTTSRTAAQMAFITANLRIRVVRKEGA